MSEWPISKWKIIGFVETFGGPADWRTYCLDPNQDVSDPTVTTVTVPHGSHSLLSDGFSYLWLMTGNINEGLVSRMGDGLSSITPGDLPTGPQVTFPSHTFGPDEWAELVANEMCDDASPNQRLRITVYP